jgi:hypothetical protein
MAMHIIIGRLLWAQYAKMMPSVKLHAMNVSGKERKDCT